MVRYIDADKLIAELQPAKNAEWNKNDHSKSKTEMIEDFCTELENAPTADVQEIRYCKFELVQDGKGVCSNCHRLDSIDKLAKYCRYCGAFLKWEDDSNG